MVLVTDILPYDVRCSLETIMSHRYALSLAIYHKVTILPKLVCYGLDVFLLLLAIVNRNSSQFVFPPKECVADNALLKSKLLYCILCWWFHTQLHTLLGIERIFQVYFVRDYAICISYVPHCACGSVLPQFYRAIF